MVFWFFFPAVRYFVSHTQPQLQVTAKQKALRSPDNTLDLLILPVKQLRVGKLKQKLQKHTTQPAAPTQAGLRPAQDKSWKVKA